MLTPNSIEILKALSKEEFKRFGDFVKSPYFNSVEVLGKIFDEIAKVYPDFESTRLSYKKISQKIYPGKEFNEQTIRNLYSKFGNLLKKFIAMENVINDEDVINMNLAEGMSKRKLFEYSNKLIEKFRREKEENKMFGFWDFYFKFRIEHLFYHNLNLLHKPNTPEFYKAMNDKTENLIALFLKAYYVFTEGQGILHNLYKGYEMSPMVKSFYSSLNSDLFFNTSEIKNHKYYSYLRMHYLTSKYQNSDLPEEEFRDLFDTFKNNIDSFVKVDKINYFTSIDALILTKLIPKDKKYYNKLFESAKLYCEQNLYPDDSIGPIEILHFRNYFTVALLLKEFGWAEKFVREYTNYLKPELVENELNYSMAILSFKNNKFEDSLSYFNKMVITDIMEKMNMRIYTLMNYIELKAHEPAISMVQALKQFSKESKEIPHLKVDSLRNSIRFLDEIVKAEANNKKIERHIYDEAMSVRFFFQKQYIMEKMEGLVE
ncbi:MAG: hypothetical protein KBG21_10740 [Ignavibacteria bacterium]|nr:hypothetical protein [Ignavibacteria bacterium]